jgi:ribosomal protein L37E
MSKYLETKKGSLEDMVAGVTEGKQSEDYKQLFKKELEKTGKGIGSMSDMEKKAFFNKIDKKYTAKNEGSKEIQKKNVRTSPGEGTGAAGGPKLTESVKVEGGPPADGGPGSGAHNHGKSSSTPKELTTKDGKVSVSKLKGTVEKELVKGKFYVDYTTKGNNTLIMDAEDEAEELIKSLKKKFGNSLDIKQDAGEVTARIKESIDEELEEGGVKDFLMDVEADAGDMSLNDLIKKYYGQMGLSAQEIKKIYYRVNEELTAGQKKLPPALQKAIKDKQDKKEVKEESEEETKSLRDTVHDIWNQAAKEEETREDEAKYYKPVEEEKKSLNEEKIKCPNCGYMNDAGADKCSNCGYDLSKKEGKHEKKKAMTGSPATKVDTSPEVEYDK